MWSVCVGRGGDEGVCVGGGRMKEYVWGERGGRCVLEGGGVCWRGEVLDVCGM